MICNDYQHSRLIARIEGEPPVRSPMGRQDLQTKFCLSIYFFISRSSRNSKTYEIRKNKLHDIDFKDASGK